MQEDTKHESFIELYEANDGDFKVEVKIVDDSVWLTQAQLSVLFDKDRSVITKHINNILNEGELDLSVCAKFAHTASDGKKYKTKYYNLDMIISVGYRVNSKMGIRFRRWSTNILKEYLLKGYSINQENLFKSKVDELQSAIDLMSDALAKTDLLNEPGEEIISIIKNYAKTWDILIKYDENKLDKPSKLNLNSQMIFSYEEAKELIGQFKDELKVEGLFGIEKKDCLKAILGNIMQSFDGKDLYSSIQEKAAHLLYFIIKDHPFTDGNKRIGSFLFLLFLKSSKIDTSKMNENTLVALALLTAESRPEQKDLMISLIMNLIT